MRSDPTYFAYVGVRESSIDSQITADWPLLPCSLGIGSICPALTLAFWLELDNLHSAAVSAATLRHGCPATLRIKRAESSMKSHLASIWRFLAVFTHAVRSS